MFQVNSVFITLNKTKMYELSVSDKIRDGYYENKMEKPSYSSSTKYDPNKDLFLLGFVGTRSAIKELEEKTL